MDIYNYIDSYGMKTFEEYPFNEVDAVLFSFLSYADYEDIVEKEKIIIKDVGRMHLGLHNKKERNIIAVRDATNLLMYIKDTKRYQNCYLYNYVYDISNDVQFSVISIEYQKNKVYVSYEGTNALISGWKENFVLSYAYPTESHKKAIEYLNKNYTFSNKQLIIGGHSKGGNLALVASMNANLLVRLKITKIYNIDGPGLLEEQYNSIRYKKILPKYEHIIPNESVVGIILHNDNTKVINSLVGGLLAHDIIYWKINKGKLVSDKLCSYSKELKKALDEYSKKYTKEELEEAVKDIYDLFVKCNIIELNDLKNINNIKRIVNESKNLNENSRIIINSLIKTIINSLSNTIQNKFKEITKIL